MSYTISNTTSDDVREFFPKAQPWRIRAITVRVDGKVIGIGGYSILSNGKKVAFLEATEETIRAYPVILYRATRKFFDEIKAEGVFRMIACSDKNREAAERWLKYLGFSYLGKVENEDVWQWQQSPRS